MKSISIYAITRKQNLAQLGCDYVPLPVTIDDGIHNRWHTNRMAEIEWSVSCPSGKSR